MQMANGKPNNFRILNNALDPFWDEQVAKISVSQPPNPVNPARKSILTVSRLSITEHDKGHASVINALPLVLEKVPDLFYDIVGSGELVTELQQLAHRKGVEDQVRFHGYVDENKLHKFYRNCDLFVMPSKKEGFGYVYLEAMSYEKPVVTGIADAGREVIYDNLAGISLDPDDDQALASGLTELLMDDTRRREIGRQGRALVSDQYSYERFQTTIQQYLSGVSTGQ
jgi:glycosyltransferase involved in cell wall biosynthesis